MPSNDASKVSCIITATSPVEVETLKQWGITVNARMGDMVVAQVPMNLLHHLGKIPSIKHVSIAQPMTLCNDSARSDGHVNVIHQSTFLPRQYTGKGVVVGIIDTGVDFNHISLMGADGKSRVRAAYLPQDTTGVSPVIDGDTLRGSHYSTPEQIALLTTDHPGSHGAHTSGIAAGGYMGNPYYGVAPDADLVICAMPLLYDTDIAASLKYIIHYADSVGRPCVINMSFSSQEGAHDGTSPMCRMFDHLSGPGRLLVISAGNDGDQQVAITHQFHSESPDTLRTYIDSYYSREHFRGFLSGWSMTNKPHNIDLSVIDYSAGKELLTIPFSVPLDSVITLSLDTVPALSPYFTGMLAAVAAVEDNGRYHSVLEMDIQVTQPQYRLGVKVSSDSDDLFRMWSSGVMMLNAVRVPGYKSASKVGSISDLATASQAISVGAYCTRTTIPSVNGGETKINRGVLHDICYFSSYGPDANGITRPDICAPGMSLVSAGNRYDSTWDINNNHQMLVVREEVGGDLYPYFGQQGTSMSAPFVTGVLALWLQARPKMTPADVRQIFDATASVDSIVSAGLAQRWGRGKINAEAGIQYLTQTLKPREKCDVNDDGLVDVTDVSELIDFILGRETSLLASVCDVNDDNLVDVTDVSVVISAILGLPY